MRRITAILFAALVLGALSLGVYAAVCRDSGGATSCGATCSYSDGNCACAGACSKLELEAIN